MLCSGHDNAAISVSPIPRTRDKVTTSLENPAQNVLLLSVLPVACSRLDRFSYSGTDEHRKQSAVKSSPTTWLDDEAHDAQDITRGE